MCTENKSTIFIYIEIYTSYKLVHPADPCLAKPWRNGQETWAGNGPVTTFGGSSIAAQSRINRGFLDHMETMSTERLTCWLSMFNITWLSSIGMKTQHTRLQHTTKYEQQLYKEWFSPIYTIDDCINRIPIADQSRCSVLQSRMSRYEGRFINLRLAFAIGSHMNVSISWLMSVFLLTKHQQTLSVQQSLSAKADTWM